jgi:hypothetical protein
MDLKKVKGGDSAHHLAAPIYRGHVYVDKNPLKHADIYKKDESKKVASKKVANKKVTSKKATGRKTQKKK